MFELLYPRTAQIDCNACKKYSFNLKTGKVNEYEGEDGKMLPVLRQGDPPCGSCPKKSPENGRRLRLRLENRLMLDFYHRFKSCPTMRSRLLDCPVTQRNIRLIDNVFELAKAKLMRRAQKKARKVH